MIKGGRYEDIIDHINGKKDDNSIDNLEPVTHKENIIRAVGKGVIQIDIETGNEIERFRTISDAFKKFNKKTGTPISEVCNNKRKSAFGYKWKYIA